MDSPSATPKHVPRFTVWFMAASTGVIVANTYYIQPLLADIARTFGLTVTKIGLVAMLAQIGTALGMLLFVPLGDNKERRSLITLMLIGAAIALTFIGHGAQCHLAGARLFRCRHDGRHTVHLFVPFAAHLAPPEERGRVVGSVFSGILLGILLARTFSGFVGAHLGWRAVYGIAAVLMLCVAALVQLLLPRSEPTRAALLSFAAAFDRGAGPQAPSTSRIGLPRRCALLRASARSGRRSSFFSKRRRTTTEARPRDSSAWSGQPELRARRSIGRLTDKRGARFAIGVGLGSVLCFLYRAGTGWERRSRA